jgi:hypothetical protein
MSQIFPTHRQFEARVRTRIRTEYPDADRESVESCVQMQASVAQWLRHLGNLIEQGVKPESRVLDTLAPGQLYDLTQTFAPRESLRWYIPAIYRTHRGLDPVIRSGATDSRLLSPKRPKGRR